MHIKPNRWFVRLLLVGMACGICFAGSVWATEGDSIAARVSNATADQKIAIITIKDEINDVTFSSMKRRIELAREDRATLVVFEMDTPGGLVSSALDICNYIKNLTELHTVAWVRPSAFSAGAMISLACDEVVMSSVSKMGDCAPIIISPTEGLKELGETERAKAESPILKEFLDSANRQNYDPLLCESMVRLGSEIWWLENETNGERRFVTRSEKESLTAEEHGRWQPVKTMMDPVSGREIDVKQPVVKERDLLTLTQSEAIAFGFAKTIVDDEKELCDYYQVSGPILRIVPTWSEGLADFLSSPMVRTILMMLIMLGIYSEFHAPGTFVGASVALVALIIFLGAPYVTGLADVWEVLLVLLGVILIAVEIFVIPGFGVAGIAGALLILIGLIATFMPAEPGPIIIPRMPGSWSGLKTGLQAVFGGMALSLVGMWFLNKYLPRVPGAAGLFLNPPSPTGTSDGAVATYLAPPPTENSIVRLGDAGTALTDLRPAGKATINGRRVDVITRGQVLDKGCTVEVIEVSGNHIVVREIVRT